MIRSQLWVNNLQGLHNTLQDIIKAWVENKFKDFTEVLEVALGDI